MAETETEARGAAENKYEDLVHVGPGTVAGRYLRMFWQPVFRARDLEPGRAVPVTILGEQFTLYRGENPSPNPSPTRGGEPPPRSLAESALSALRTPSPDSSGHSESLPKGKGAGGLGAPHLVAFRCAHRGTQLSVGWVEDDCIRCRYHGWKYDASGQCVEQPGEDESFARRVSIRAYPTQDYAGLVFAYLGEGDPPPFRRYPELDQPGVIIVDPPERLPCSFWNRFDNDNAHLAWTHRSTALRTGQTDYLLPRTETFQETEYGFMTESRAEGRALSRSRFYMPNTQHWRSRSRTRTHAGQNLFETKFTWAVAVDDTHYVAFDVTLTPLTDDAGEAYLKERETEQEPQVDRRWEIANAILAGQMTIEDIPDDISFYNLNAIDDYVTQVGQGAIANRSPGVEHLSRTDQRVVFKRLLWLRELRALAEGRPLTAWRVPQYPLYDADSGADEAR